jgi:uncharacterized protein YeaO (DUF488 family)
MINVKRIYDPPAESDGRRILVDRLWPRGLRKEAARIDEWVKEVSPSSELRLWYGHEPAKWREFKRRYFTELRAQQEAVKLIVSAAKNGTVTLLYSSTEDRYNNAVALKVYLEAKLHAAGRKRAA